MNRPVISNAIAQRYILMQSVALSNFLLSALLIPEASANAGDFPTPPDNSKSRSDPNDRGRTCVATKIRVAPFAVHFGAFSALKSPATSSPRCLVTSFTKSSYSTTRTTSDPFMIRHARDSEICRKNMGSQL